MPCTYTLGFDEFKPRFLAEAAPVADLSDSRLFWSPRAKETVLPFAAADSEGLIFGSRNA